MEKVVKTVSGYQIEGRETYEDGIGVEHTITWKRLISEKEANEFIARRKQNAENIDANKENKTKKQRRILRLPIRKKRPFR